MNEGRHHEFYSESPKRSRRERRYFSLAQAALKISHTPHSTIDFLTIIILVGAAFRIFDIDQTSFVKREGVAGRYLPSPRRMIHQQGNCMPALAAWPFRETSKRLLRLRAN
jgi:hypothetical protein